MSRRIWSAFSALLVLISLTIAVLISPQAAYATISQINWTGSPLVGSTLFTHDGNYLTTTPLNDSCGQRSDTTVTVATVTTTGSGAGVVYGQDAAWQMCGITPLTGMGGTSYIVQSRKTSPRVYRIAAISNGAVIWARAFPTGTCAYSVGAVSNLTWGYDGNIYATVSWGDWDPCHGELALVSIDPTTGALRFQTNLPDRNSSASSEGLGNNEIMPYEDGVAVVNNGVNVYYYDYAGVQDTSKTFSPTWVGTEKHPSWSAITPNGRTFIMARYYNSSSVSTVSLFYKDLNSATTHRIDPPAGRGYVGLYATPDGGFATRLVDTSDPSHHYLGYFDSTGNEAYEADLTSASGANLRYPTAPVITVDSEGNAIVVRLMAMSATPNDQVIYVDSYSPTGTDTRLYDSGATYGTSGQDTFTFASWGGWSIGNGTIYLIQCQQSGVYSTACPSWGNPKIIKIPFSGAFDYPRSEIYHALNHKARYVALGDSYSAGEGLPPFVTSTDNNGGDGCDRSEAGAYPTLTAFALDLRLSAFVACSGATSSEVFVGKHGEPGQLTSLNEDTNIVSITAGGNDAEFTNFAKACVITTVSCDAGSSAYQDTMDIIDNNLQGNLEALYTLIHSAAPNAEVYVLGYPNVTLGSSTGCPSYITGIEQSAIDTVITSINNKVRAAIQNSDSSFHFLDPTVNGSPFDGHDLCSGSSSYFFGLNIAETRFSFHPNASGQAAYAQMLADAIS